MLKLYHDYKYACYYDSKLRKACDTVLLSAPIITATILVGIGFFNMSDSQILEAIGFGMISAIACLCCYSIIDDIIPYPQNEFEQTLISDITDKECEITSLF
ncbi:hypothetical protein [Candidatus Mesenet endosymbiont of Agriotes lineatus]|uniref:hypothetical protein n=1 Tax=Candidatus Mesenet endosymbiont of Agriotes lineatus TaxID=3077948 RepID=UPI0030D1C35A